MSDRRTEKSGSILFVHFPLFDRVEFRRDFLNKDAFPAPLDDDIVGWLPKRKGSFSSLAGMLENRGSGCEGVQTAAIMGTSTSKLVYTFTCEPSGRASIPFRGLIDNVTLESGILHPSLPVIPSPVSYCPLIPSFFNFHVARVLQG